MDIRNYTDTDTIIRQRADERLGDDLRKVFGSREWSETAMEETKRTLEVHCFCVCSGSALLGELESSLGYADIWNLSAVFFPRIFLHVFIVYDLLLRMPIAVLILLQVHVCWLFLV